MRHAGKTLLALVGLVLILGALAPAAVFADPLVFVRTDGDDVNCTGAVNAAYPGAGGPGLPCAKQTIAGGIAVVDEGGTVQVAAGSYDLTTPFDEVNKSITLLGAQHGVDARTRAVPVAQESVLTTDLLLVNRDSITVDGFTFDNATLATGLIFGGGLHSGFHLTNNIFANTEGFIGLSSDGVLPTTIDKNRFDGADGIINGSIASGLTLSNVLIDSNKFGDNGILLSGGIAFPFALAPFSDITVTNNESASVFGFILGTRVKVTGNTFTGSSSYGVVMEGVDDGTISGNTIDGATTAGIFVTIVVPLAVPTDVAVECNTLTNNTVGVAAQGGATVNFNNFQGNTAALANAFPTLFDAEHNYYGSATGPTAADNPGGTGDPVPAGVDYRPFLTAAVDPSDCPPQLLSVTAGPDLKTTEAGGTATFDVVLDFPPTSNVTVPLSSSNTAEGTVSPASLTFTPANYNTPQTVTVTGVDDPIVDGDQAYQVVIGKLTGGGGTFSHLDPPDVDVTNVDDDTAGISITPGTGATDEDGASATFDVVLDTQPSARVRIPLSSSDATEGSVVPGSIVFTPDSWDIPQTVTVLGVNDDVVDGDVAYNLVTGAAVSTDTNYSGLDAIDPALTNADNDQGPVRTCAGRPGTVFGTSGDDSLVGTAGADVFVAGAGNDTIIGRGGDDVICGGLGDDKVLGGAGDDLVYGGAGNDVLSGGLGDDRLFGGGGIDVLRGGDDADRLFGEAGNDRLFGQQGTDRLAGREGNDYLSGGDDADVLDGGVGNDRLIGGNDADDLFGREGDDILRGGNDDDRLHGGLGADDLFGGSGADQLAGEGGKPDSCDGGPDTDVPVTAAGCEVTTSIP